MSNSKVETGTNRQVWFANLTDSAAQWSFLEDSVGTQVATGQVSRSLRLGDPINTGPNSGWHQLTWQGGAQQDLWNDEAMYAAGNVDVLSYTGKARMWPGFQSWWKKYAQPHAHSMAMCVAPDQNLDWRVQPLLIGERDRGPWDERAATYGLTRIQNGLGRGTAGTLQHIATSTTGPWRILSAAQSDNYAAGVTICCTATKFYQYVDSSQALIQDTNAPNIASLEYTWDTGVNYGNAFFYGYGNRLYKRVPLAPYGVLGTHTLVHTINSAKYVQSMTTWNNRIYFGVFYPTGKAAVFVSDGATTVKAFDFPHTFWPRRMLSVAGSLYILGMQPSGTQGNNIVQQLWRYDGTSLKKVWQEGHLEDGALHYASDLIQWNGMVVWACQGTRTSGSQTGVPGNNFACLMFYDPVNDAIVPGPGLDVAGSNTSGNLWITDLCEWNNTIAATFKDDTNYASASIDHPVMVASVRPQDFTRHDLRWPESGPVGQFQDPASTNRYARLNTSEFHGQDDVANVPKTWLSLKLRVKFTSTVAKMDIAVQNGTDALSSLTIASGLTDDGSHDWQDIVVPIKKGDNSYFTSKKLQVLYVLYNADIGQPDSQQNTWIDDASVQYVLSPTKTRQWTIRIPITEAQLTLAGATNSLGTSALLEQKLQDLYFAGKPVKFWPPTTSSSNPGTSGSVEVLIQSAIFSEARLASDETGIVGSVALTLVENVTNA